MAALPHLMLFGLHTGAKKRPGGYKMAALPHLMLFGLHTGAKKRPGG